MAKIERFEDIQVWQKARELNKEIYNITKNPIFFKRLLFARPAPQGIGFNNG